MKVAGTFNGTGAAVYLCLGFVPDYVKITAAGDAENAVMWYSKNMRVAAVDNGYMRHGTGQAVTRYTAGTGIEPYEGGEVLTSAMQTSTGYGEGVYLGWDRQNYSRNSSYGYQDEAITSWTLDTAANRTGKFNDDVPAAGTTRIGPGSLIKVMQGVSNTSQWALIEALTAGQGEADNEVTLSRALASGEVMYISGMYSLAPITVGKETPAGIKLNVTADINVNDEIQMFEAGTYDDRDF